MNTLILVLAVAAVAWLFCIPGQIGEVIDGLRDVKEGVANRRARRRAKKLY